MTIWKFKIDIADEVEVTMPDNGHVLSVGVQYGRPCLWALVDPSAPFTVRHFAWRGTGHQGDGIEAARFIGTIQLDDGALVFHLFEKGMDRSHGVIN
jgi:hypothetical protein